MTVERIDAIALADEERRDLRELQLLTAKPVMYVANVNESGFSNNPHLAAVEKRAAGEGAAVVPVCAAIEAEIKSISKLEHTLARTRIVLQEQASRLRLGTNPELVMTSLRLAVPHETTLALIERVDPVLSTHVEQQLPPKN